MRHLTEKERRQRGVHIYKKRGDVKLGRENPEMRDIRGMGL